MNPSSQSNALVIFARYPRKGKSKTRLIPALGQRGAAELHRCMTGHTLLTARRASCEQGFDLRVYGTGAGTGSFRRWLGRGPEYRRQAGGDLGQRMTAAFRKTCGQSERVIIIGTDCPDLTPAILGEAFAKLTNHEMVIGPATDGGYYLIGLQHPIPGLFENITWGGSDVLNQTLSRAQKLDLNFARLPPLPDVDRPEDLPVWDAATGVGSQLTSDCRVSVVIPALNEGERIGSLLERTRPDAHEIIVVDGGSEDATRDIAYSKGARVISAPRNRACQMNVGAQAATGNILLFLHADTVLPPHFTMDIKPALRRKTVAGAFRFRIRGDRRAFRTVEAGTHWRSRLCRLPYGDQAIFMPADRFRAMGGYALLPLMEDFELMCRLRRLGRIGIARRCAITSSRRWTHLGVARTTWINQLVVLGYQVGIAPERLARFYRRQDT